MRKRPGDGQKGHEYRGHDGRRYWQGLWSSGVGIEQPSSESGDSQVPLSMLGTGATVSRQVKKPVRTLRSAEDRSSFISLVSLGRGNFVSSPNTFVRRVGREDEFEREDKNPIGN